MMTRIEPASNQECERALAHVLAPDDSTILAATSHVHAFQKYMNACGLDWAAWRCGPRGRESAWLFMLYLPGSTAIAMLAPPTLPAINPNDQLTLVDAGLRAAAEQRLYYVQALVAPQASEKRDILHAAGFRHLTQLIYLQRPVSAVSGVPSLADKASWVSYSPQTHDEFAHILLETYLDSDDCPELSGLRPIDDAIASHKASGLFDPELWEIAKIDGVPAGCLLLSPHAQGAMIEIVYLGTARSWRRNGVGSLLIRRAVEHARATRKREITAVVDARNAPARQLYARFAFKATTTREAYIHACSRAE